MLAIGAYGAALPVVHLGVPFLAALVFATMVRAPWLGYSGDTGVRFAAKSGNRHFVFQAVVIILLREAKTLTGGAEGLHVPPPVVFGFSFSNDANFLLLGAGLFAAAILPIAVLLAGPFGKNLRAIAANENAARAFGIDVRNYLIAAFTWSSAVIAFAGAVSAPRFRIIDPDSYGVITSIFTLTYPIIGGMGSIWGGLIGGGVLRLFPELLRPLADYIELVFCVLVVGTLTFSPEGLASAIWMLGRRGQRKATGAAIARGRPVVKVADLPRVSESSRSAHGEQSLDTPVLAIKSIHGHMARFALLTAYL